MNYLNRYIEKSILERINDGKVIVILGPRRVGKTCLIEKLNELIKEDFLLINGDDLTSRNILENKSLIEYKEMIGSKKLLIIDEAQKINRAGEIIKIIADEIKGLKIIVSGSSALDINNRLGEPLTGRQYPYKLYPFAQCELNNLENIIETKSRINLRLIYGVYPEIELLHDLNRKKEYLSILVNSYLFKDLLELDSVKNSNKILQILKLLAFQIGSTVSINEISTQLSMSKILVEKYLDLLEKVYIIFTLTGYSRNLRKEISKSNKYYFIDNGIRNALINNFNPIDTRNDIGQLWENYIISERIKWQSYSKIYSNNYFWRTYDRQEIDWIEERDGKLYAYEIKYKKGKSKIPKAWREAYKDSEFEVIDSENYLKFIGSPFSSRF